jgi:hypothetical protein
MITLLGSLLGFASSTGVGIFKEVMNARQDSKDKAHELSMIAQASADRREEAVITSIGTANIEIQKTVQNVANNSSQWVNNISGLIRPSICAFFALEFFVLTILVAFGYIDKTLFETIWSTEQSSIFAAVISFYFGNRMTSKFVK